DRAFGSRYVGDFVVELAIIHVQKRLTLGFDQDRRIAIDSAVVEIKASDASREPNMLAMADREDCFWIKFGEFLAQSGAVEFWHDEGDLLDGQLRKEIRIKVIPMFVAYVDKAVFLRSAQRFQQPRGQMVVTGKLEPC